MKKIIATIAAASTLLTLAVSPNMVHATNFEGKEDEYMELCASSSLSNSQVRTCKEFNTYLKQKNQDVQNQAEETKNSVSETQGNIDDLVQQITALDDEIAQKETEIAYLETSIKNLEDSIAKKETEVKDRMYAMQSYTNNNSYIDYVFGAENFTEMFSRIDSINQITSYDEDLIKSLAAEKEEVASQKATVETVKANIEAERTNKATLQSQYQEQYNQLNAQLIEQEKQAAKLADSSADIDDNLAAIAAAAAQSQVSVSPGSGASGIVVTGNSALGNAIAQKAMTQIGNMYLWGGGHSMSEITNPNTTRLDCSGLVSWAHYQSGVNIGSQTTKTLANLGVSVSRSSMQAGDIILFSSGGYSGVHHVGIYIGGGNMVHAPSTGKATQVASLSYSYWQAEWYDVRRLY